LRHIIIIVLGSKDLGVDLDLGLRSHGLGLGGHVVALGLGLGSYGLGLETQVLGLGIGLDGHGLDSISASDPITGKETFSDLLCPL